ncbi:MAG: ATP-dependent helicase [Phycisphaeraceae bacterium]|nr:ATP-dependent helicase [Phycisphaeraceae bacterium]MCW5763031.1 ATP-dependent helicase [Phycisphaeraceae bacterium]
MRTPTPEQLAVLNDPGLVRVVRASPGSGKTVLVGMLIRKELENWPRVPGGIAALSFTRVGGQEIRKELGYDLGHPHFVGTIDAFLFRYVLRPFVRQVHPTWKPPRLIPAEWSPKHWGKRLGGAQWDHRGGGGQNVKSYNLFEVCFIDQDANGPVLAHPRTHQAGLEQVTANDRAGLLTAKRQMWQRLGWFTHADAALLASELLDDANHGASIRATILHRFPLLIVDELQDTGFFLAKCVRLLLSQQTARGILVGDPNQAIYEFNGARPALFNEFEQIPTATSLPLGRSQRCLAPVVAAAIHVKESTDAFNPTAGDGGRAILVRYADMLADMPRIVQAVRTAKPTATTKIIARQSKTAEELTARSVKDAGSLHCPAMTHMYRAVRAFRQGHNVQGLANGRAGLELAVFGYEGVSDETLAEHKIDPREWKALAVHCLLRSNALPTTLNLREWQTAAGSLVDDAIAAFGLPTSLPFQPGQFKPKKRTGWDKACSEFLPTGAVVGPLIADVPVQTVHSVKGETHDVTIFVCPNPSTVPRCPSVVWWSNNPEHREERRIAYVAMTRTRADLVVCVSDACYQRLAQTQAAFVGSFQCVTVDEFLVTYAAAATPTAHLP